MKTTNKTDWHPAIIVARLRMSGTSLRQLSKDNNLYPTALSVALKRPWLKAERIIATAIGIAPSQIWPTRYEHRAAKQERRNSPLVDTHASIGQCSHDCNINIAEKA